MERHGFVWNVHHKKPPHRDMPPRTRRSNAGKSVIRSSVEHVFADQNPEWVCSFARSESNGPK